MKWAYLLNLSTSTMRESYPLDFGNPLMKSINISSHTRFGMGSGCNSPAGITDSLVPLTDYTFSHMSFGIKVWSKAGIKDEDLERTNLPSYSKIHCSNENLATLVGSSSILYLMLYNSSSFKTSCTTLILINEGVANALNSICTGIMDSVSAVLLFNPG